MITKTIEYDSYSNNEYESNRNCLTYYVVCSAQLLCAVDEHLNKCHNILYSIRTTALIITITIIHIKL